MCINVAKPDAEQRLRLDKPQNLIIHRGFNARQVIQGPQGGFTRGKTAKRQFANHERVH